MLKTTCNLILMTLRARGSCTIDELYRLTRRGKTEIRENISRYLDLGEEEEIVDGVRVISYFVKPFQRSDP